MDENRMRWFDYLQPYEVLPEKYIQPEKDTININLNDAVARINNDSNFKGKVIDSFVDYFEAVSEGSVPEFACNGLRLCTLMELAKTDSGTTREFDMDIWLLILALLRQGHPAGVYYISIFMGLGIIPTEKYGDFSVESDAFSFFEKLLIDGNPYAIRHWLAIKDDFESQPFYKRFGVPKDWFEKWYGKEC